MFAALIFDVDGTLSETEELHRRAFNETFADHGLPWHWNVHDYRDLLKVTGGKERIAAFVRDHRRETPDRDIIAALHKAKTERYVDLVARGGLRLRPGIKELIESARSVGVRVAVATTTSRPNVASLCKSCFGAPMDDVFDVVAAGDEVERKKPAPDVYDLALARLGLSTGDCVAIEDSRNGLLSAKAAGILCIVSPSRYTVDDDFSSADALVPCFGHVGGIEGLKAAFAHAA